MFYDNNKIIERKHKKSHIKTNREKSQVGTKDAVAKFT